MKKQVLYIRDYRMFPDRSKSWNSAKNKYEKREILLNILNKYMGGREFTYEYLYEKCQIQYTWNMIIKHLTIIFVLFGIFYYWLFIPAIILFFVNRKVKEELIHNADVYFSLKKAFNLEDNWQIEKTY